MVEDPATTLEAAERRIVEHQGYKNYAEARALEATIKDVVEPNWRGLLGHLDAPAASVDLAIALIQNIGSSAVRDLYMSRLNRHLHNYLAGAYTLVDHVRRVVKERVDDVSDRHEHRMTELLTHPELPFVQGLRNFTLHRTLPLVNHQLSFQAMNTPDALMESRILLSRPSLLEWDGWSAAARLFMAEEGDEINLRSVIATHGELVLTANTHLLNDLVEGNSELLGEVNQLVDARNQILTGGHPFPNFEELHQKFLEMKQSEELPDAPHE